MRDVTVCESCQYIVLMCVTMCVVGVGAAEDELLKWVRSKIPEYNIQNFTKGKQTNNRITTNQYQHQYQRINIKHGNGLNLLRVLLSSLVVCVYKYIYIYVLCLVLFCYRLEQWSCNLCTCECITSWFMYQSCITWR
jgi:hypothetical protein